MGLALRVRMVLRDATDLAFTNQSGDECEPITSNSRWIRRLVQFVLEVLARSNRAGRWDGVAVGRGLLSNLAQQQECECAAGIEAPAT